VLGKRNNKRQSPGGTAIPVSPSFAPEDFCLQSLLEWLSTLRTQIFSMQEKTFWLDTVEIAAPSPRDFPQRIDVAVIGAGFTGLSAARTLAKSGATVAVFDSQTIGWGASSRNGGMVLTGLKLPAATLISRYGKEATARMYAASLESIDFVEKLVCEENIACDFVRCGHLEVACKPKHFDDFRRSAEETAHHFNHQQRIIPKEQLHSEIGSTIYHGGLVDDSSAGLNPARFVAGLAIAAQRAGAAVFEQAHVDQVQREGASGWKVATARGTLRAENVFVATSGYTSRVTPTLQKKIIPIGSYIIVTEILPEKLAAELSPRNRMIYDSKNYLYYYRLTPDRRMLFGGRAAFFPETADTIRRSAEILRRGMLSVYPQLRDAKIEYVWGGTLDFAFDIMPHAGQLDGLHFSLGYAGHGVGMSTYLGDKVAQSILQGHSADPRWDENPFAQIPFPGAPLNLYNGRPWFLPAAGLWYKLLDFLS
jgi:glycine/D-amino acid oxidase-like deaminating enzyme